MKGHNSFSIKAFGKYHFNWKSDRIGKGTLNQDWFKYSADIERDNIEAFENAILTFDDDSSETIRMYLEQIEISKEKIWECEHSEMLWNEANNTSGLKI